MTDINTVAWSQIDDDNDQAPPAGWPEGMMPSGVNNAARAMMGAIRRWYDRVQPTLQSTGTGNAFVLTYPVAPSAPIAGDVVWWYPHTDAADGGCTLDIGDGGGPKPLVMADGVTQPRFGAVPAFYPVLCYFDAAHWRIVLSTGFLFRRLGTPPYHLGVSGTLPSDLNGDVFVGNTSAAPIVIAVPNGSFEGQRLRFKDTLGLAGTYPILLSPGAPIDGGSELYINSPYGTAELIWLGTRWGTVASGTVELLPKPPPITLVSSDNAIPAGEQQYFVANGSGAPITIFLHPGGYPNQRVSFKDIAGNASAHAIGIVPTGATIDGMSSLPIVSDYASYDLVWTGSNWGMI